jgi:FixJ family two-component response regulator
MEIPIIFITSHGDIPMSVDPAPEAELNQRLIS